MWRGEIHEKRKFKTVFGLLDILMVCSLLMLTKLDAETLLSQTILIGGRPQSRAPDWLQSLSVMTEWVGTEMEMSDLSWTATQSEVHYIGYIYIFKNKRGILIMNTNRK